MKTTIRDIETLSAIRPLDMVAYLRSNGWEQAQILERGAFWLKVKNDQTFELLLPLDSTVRDLPYRMAEVLQTLEDAEGRSQLEIIDDVVMASADVIRSRLPGAQHSGEISVERGRLVYEQARNLMLAAACAAVEKRPLFAKRKPEQAMQFLEHARFGVPEGGSYVLKIISPVSPKLVDKDLFGEEIAEEPFERKTVRVLAQAVYALVVASRDVALTGGIEPMKAAVARGVSANLCEAIVGLHEGSGEKGVEFSFSWAPLRGAPSNVVSQVAITPDSIPIIGETARIFRETESVESTEVLGIVNKLQHQDGNQGKVTIAGSADGIARTVTLELSGPDHTLAVRSYEDRIPISCVGELTREGRSWVLKNPREIDLIVNDDGSEE
ncbi:MAG: hypothetical protein JOZ08_09250 [Verrucomicrobia bacterium]|nr:hypothetical protein [Verrucomicrobiota bacterium]